MTKAQPLSAEEEAENRRNTERGGPDGFNESERHELRRIWATLDEARAQAQRARDGALDEVAFALSQFAAGFRDGMKDTNRRTMPRKEVLHMLEELAVTVPETSRALKQSAAPSQGAALERLRETLLELLGSMTVQHDSYIGGLVHEALSLLATLRGGK